MITQKLILGNCLEKMKDIPDKSIDLILCDLPYQKTSCSWDNMIPFEPLWEQYNRIIKDNGAIVLFGSQPFTSMLVVSNLKNFKYSLVWEKQQATNPMCAKKRIMPKHEDILIFYKKQPTYNPQMSYGYKNYIAFNNANKQIGEIYGDLKSKHRNCSDGSRYPTSILKFNTERTKLHPTQKPVALLEYLIKTYTQENELVLDNCFGSNSTGVACVNTNRNYIGIEKDGKYFQIGVDRVQKFVKENNIGCKVIVE